MKPVNNNINNINNRKMKLVNNRTGQFRELTPAEAFLGTLFLGPIYVLFKGAWTWGLLMLAINLLLLAAFPPLLFFAWFIWAAAAQRMIESFYEQRGFVAEPTPESPLSPSNKQDHPEVKAIGGGIS